MTDFQLTVLVFSSIMIVLMTVHYRIAQSELRKIKTLDLTNKDEK